VQEQSQVQPANQVHLENGCGKGGEDVVNITDIAGNGVGVSE